MLDLNSEYVAMVQHILATHIPHKTVWVYGSRIKGSAHDGSDLDLAVIDPISEKTLSVLRNAFSDSNLPILVDVYSWKNIPAAFKIEITRAHEIFEF